MSLLINAMKGAKGFKLVALRDLVLLANTFGW